MATPFSTIYDQFMILVKDYRLTTLYNSSVTDFETFLSGWLLPAITEFKSCNQSLVYTGSSFTATLNVENIKILALLMKKFWLKRQIEDITQMNLHVQDRDFKTFAEANNITGKLQVYNSDLEEVSQLLMSYNLDEVDWASWYGGTFYVPA